MVASVDHLASNAGLAMLQRGGSAVDAAVAASAVLAVTAPHLCGMGGDLFALVFDPNEPKGTPPATLNASGRAGSGADPEARRAAGLAAMPFTGSLHSAPVPGCVDGWIAVHERYGRLPLADVLEPAVGYAASGFPAGPLLAATVPQLRDVEGAGDLTGNLPLRTGQTVHRPGVALALEAVALNGRAGFYEGPFGDGLIELGDGEYTADDLRQPLADWVEPLRVRVWDHDVWTAPPNSQGYVTLLGCAIAEHLDLPDDSRDGLWAHLLVEAARAAAHDRPDMLFEGADVDDLLAADEIARRAALVSPDRRAALAVPVGAGDTMYLCAVDRDGMGVSFIQSNASGFGCLVFEPETGIGLHNRGIGFNLVPGHPAEYGPGRRPPHTLAPALVTRADGSLRAVIGTMGGDAQPHVLLQLLVRLLKGKESAGATISAPRFALSGSARSTFDTWSDPDGVRVEIESDAAAWRPTLEDRGHEVKVVDGVVGTFGHAHLIEVTGGRLAGLADPRALIGEAAAY
jgi:gamma-glutamyltranspeptidase/glutathione hydrolase